MKVEEDGIIFPNEEESQSGGSDDGEDEGGLEVDVHGSNDAGDVGVAELEDAFPVPKSISSK